MSDWVERIGWPRFFEKCDLPFTKYLIDDWRGSRANQRLHPHPVLRTRRSSASSSAKGPYTHQASDSAWQFCQAAIAQATRSSASSSITTGLQRDPLTEPPQDDRHIVNRWSTLKEQHGVDLVVCVAAALRRGIKDEVLAPGFRISGLGQLVDSGIKADRMVTFGD